MKDIKIGTKVFVSGEVVNCIEGVTEKKYRIKIGNETIWVSVENLEVDNFDTNKCKHGGKQ